MVVFILNPYAAGGKKSWKMTETLAYGYLFESTLQELSNGFQRYLHFSVRDESSLSIERDKVKMSDSITGNVMLNIRKNK